MNETRKYAASFILDMRDTTEGLEAVIERLSNAISEIGGNVTEVKNLGQKDFERVADRKFSNGIYVQIMFEGASNMPADLKTKLSLDKTINRVLIEVVR